MSEALSLTKLAGLLRSGLSLEQALDQVRAEISSSKGLRFLLTVAEHSGSAVAVEIEFVAEILGARDRANQRIKVAHASPKSTARLMLWLPIVTLCMAQLLGWGVLDALVTNPLVILSLALGLGLLLFSKLVTGRLLKHAEPSEDFTGFYLLGVAMACSGGMSLLKAQRVSLNLYQEVFQVTPSQVEQKALEEIVQLADHSGARVVELLRRQAQQMQEDINHLAELRIEKLSIRLMLPLGLGVLPAFVLLAIVPLMVTTLGFK